MQTRFKDGSVMVCGGCSRDAVLEYVGQDGKRLCKVGVAVGRRPGAEGEKPETIWCNLVAWHEVAQVLSAARKGDPVFAVGRLQTRQYNGKEYTDLVAEFVAVCAPGVPAAYGAPVPQPSGFQEIDEDDGYLPF